LSKNFYLFTPYPINYDLRFNYDPKIGISRFLRKIFRRVVGRSELEAAPVDLFGRNESGGSHGVCMGGRSAERLACCAHFECAQCAQTVYRVFGVGKGCDVGCVRPVKSRRGHQATRGRRGGTPGTSGCTLLCLEKLFPLPTGLIRRQGAIRGGGTVCTPKPGTCTHLAGFPGALAAPPLVGILKRDPWPLVCAQAVCQ